MIVGPTCTGKTKTAAELASIIKGEIISADSRQIYKHLNIGTAKPDEKLLKKIKHHFIDSLELNEKYNVSRFEVESLKLIEQIFQKGKSPVVAGGSGLYIRALTDGIFNSVDTDNEYREELMILRRQKGNEFIYKMLEEIDPLSAKKMLPQNWKRVIRALEVFYLSGKSILEWQKNYERITPFTFLQYGLKWDRERLYLNIEKRVDEMIKEGLIEETENILSRGFHKDCNALNTVGYKEIISYLQNEISLERAIELIKINTRRYAKRQLTWFNKDKRVKWIEISVEEDLSSAAAKIAEEYLDLNRKESLNIFD